MSVFFIEFSFFYSFLVLFLFFCFFIIHIFNREYVIAASYLAIRKAPPCVLSQIQITTIEDLQVMPHEYIQFKKKKKKKKDVSNFFFLGARSNHQKKTKNFSISPFLPWFLAFLHFSFNFFFVIFFLDLAGYQVIRSVIVGENVTKKEFFIFKKVLFSFLLPPSFLSFLLFPFIFSIFSL